MKPARVLSSFEQETVATIQEKINQPLFETTIRAFMLLDDKQEQNQRIQGIKSSLAPFKLVMILPYHLINGKNFIIWINFLFNQTLLE